MAASQRELDGRTRYGGPWFVEASALPLIGDEIGVRSVARLVAASMRRPRRVVALSVLLVRTPREYVALSETSAGQALGEYFGERSFCLLPRKRFFRGVLLLPTDHADYIRGRRRQALRTNLQRAATAGIQCEVMSDAWCAAGEISRVLRRQWSSLPDRDLQARLRVVSAFVARSDVTVVIARDDSGQPLAIAAALVDDSVCVVQHAVATSHEARWALHDYLVRFLIARRVRCLLVDGGGPFGALGAGRNVQHYQHLLGYELRHVIPAGTRGHVIRADRRRMTRRRRLVVSLALAAAAFAAVVPRAIASPADIATVDRTMRHPVLLNADSTGARNEHANSRVCRARGLNIRWSHESEMAATD